MRALRRKLIDFEMDLVPFDRQVNDPAERSEALAFAHSQSG